MWENERMVGVVELLDVKEVVFEFDDSSFVFVHVTIVGGTKDSDDLRKVGGFSPPVHFVALHLCLMSSNH